QAQRIKTRALENREVASLRVESEPQERCRQTIASEIRAIAGTGELSQWAGSVGRGGNGAHRCQGRKRCRITAIESDAGRTACKESILLHRRRWQCSTLQKRRLFRSDLDDERAGQRREDPGGVKGYQAKIPVGGPDTGKSSFMPPGNFVRKVVVRLVLLDRAAEGGTGLHPGISRVRHVAEWIHCLEAAVAQVAEKVAVKLV